MKHCSRCFRHLSYASKDPVCWRCRGAPRARERAAAQRYVDEARARLAEGVRHLDPDEVRRYEAEIKARDAASFRKPDNAPLIYVDRKPPRQWRRRR